MVEPQKVSNFAIANGADKDARERQIRQETSTEATPKGAIAQLVEQRTENPCVPGSIPGGTTRLMKLSLHCTLSVYWVSLFIADYLGVSPL